MYNYIMLVMFLYMTYIVVFLSVLFLLSLTTILLYHQFVDTQQHIFIYGTYCMLCVCICMVRECMYLMRDCVSVCVCVGVCVCVCVCMCVL